MKSAPRGQRAVYGALARDGFAAYRLEVTGRVGRPASFSLDELRGLPARTQLSRHVCIQGWTAVGEWTGVRVRDVLARCKPLAGARYVAFHGFDEKSETDAQPPGRYYEMISLPRRHEDFYSRENIVLRGSVRSLRQRYLRFSTSAGRDRFPRRESQAQLLASESHQE